MGRKIRHIVAGSLMAVGASAAFGQVPAAGPQFSSVLTFAPQDGDRVATWSVVGCPGRAIPIAMVLAAASEHGVPWIEPKTAEKIYKRKSWWSRAVRIAGFASAGGGALMTLKVVAASPQKQAAVLVAGALLTVLVPLARREIPTIDPTVGGSLRPDVNGCGTTSFYAHPSSVAGFSADVRMR